MATLPAALNGVKVICCVAAPAPLGTEASAANATRLTRTVHLALPGMYRRSQTRPVKVKCPRRTQAGRSQLSLRASGRVASGVRCTLNPVEPLSDFAKLREH